MSLGIGDSNQTVLFIFEIGCDQEFYFKAGLLLSSYGQYWSLY